MVRNPLENQGFLQSIKQCWLDVFDSGRELRAPERRLCRAVRIESHFRLGNDRSLGVYMAREGRAVFSTFSTAQRNEGGQAEKEGRPSLQLWLKGPGKTVLKPNLTKPKKIMHISWRRALRLHAPARARE